MKAPWGWAPRAQITTEVHLMGQVWDGPSTQAASKLPRWDMSCSKMFRGRSEFCHERYLLSPQSPRLDCQTLTARITVAVDSRIRKLKTASSTAPANSKGVDCSMKFSKHRAAALTPSAYASVFPDAQMNTTASWTAAAGESAPD